MVYLQNVGSLIFIKLNNFKFDKMLYLAQSWKLLVYLAVNR